MKLGLFNMPLHPPGRRHADTYDEDLELMENFWIVGDPDECAGQIRQLHKDTGGFGTLLILCHDWGTDRAKGLRSLELLATETLPQLADLTLGE